MSSSGDNLRNITLARRRLPAARNRFVGLAGTFLERAGTVLSPWVRSPEGAGFERHRRNELVALVGVTARYGFECDNGEGARGFRELASRQIRANRAVGVRETSQVEAVGKNRSERGEEYLRVVAVRTVLSGVTLPTDMPVSDEELASAMDEHGAVSSLGWRHDEVPEEYAFGFTAKGTLLGTDTNIGGVHATLLEPMGSNIQDLPGAVAALGAASHRIEEGLGMHVPRIRG